MPCCNMVDLGGGGGGRGEGGGILVSDFSLVLFL